MKSLVAAALCLAAVPALASGDGPFCVYSSGGLASCFYYTIDSCRMAAKSLNGMCAPNNTTQIQQAPQPQHRQPATPQPSIMGMMQSIQVQGDAGRQRGMEQREFEARMALMRAQQEQAQAEAAAAAQRTQSEGDGVALWDAVGQAAQNAAAPGQASTAGRSLFRCPRGDGTAVITYVPEPGCIFLGETN